MGGISLFAGGGVFIPPDGILLAYIKRGKKPGGSPHLIMQGHIMRAELAPGGHHGRVGAPGRRIGWGGVCVVVGGGGGGTAAAVVEQGVDGVLKHALLVVDEDLGGTLDVEDLLAWSLSGVYDGSHVLTLRGEGELSEDGRSLSEL